ncbi:hypothetical protein FLX35_06555 [Cylindrospermopsis raciborskii LB2897]|jgi:hypothetical protein|nr:hypothetical protein [Cylindrospermopsis raciborskii LB2897]
MKNSHNNILIPPKLPFLEAICWQTKNVYAFSLEEMLTSYERGWRYRSLFNNLESDEVEFIKTIAQEYQSWLIVELCSLN